MDANKRLKEDLEQVKKSLNILEVRVTLAQLWVGLYTKAYDALLHYGVNFRELPEYKDDTTIDEVQDLPITQARNRLTGWIGKVHNGIEAAIKRKGFHIV